MGVLKIHRRDRVRVLSGRDKGKEGEVVKVLSSSLPGRVFVKGINLTKRHLKAREGRAAGILESEKAIAASKVGVVCRSCQKVTRVGARFENGKKVRFCHECQSNL